MQEDFHTLTYGFKMAGDETEAAVISPVKELEEELGRIIKVGMAFYQIISLLLYLCIPLSVLAPLVWQLEGHLVYKNLLQSSQMFSFGDINVNRITQLLWIDYCEILARIHCTVLS